MTAWPVAAFALYQAESRLGFTSCSIVQYRSGQEEAARQVARLLPADAQTETQPTPGLRTDVGVVLGRDWTQVAACLEHGTCCAATSAVAMAAAPVH